MFLSVVTPSCWTSSGRRLSDDWTRFWTSTCAVSRLVPSLKTTLIVTAPFPVDDEVM